MRRCKRIVAVILAGILMMGALSGCSKEQTADKNKKEIEIKIWQAGMGIKWLENVIEGFEKKYPEYTVKYTASADVAGVTAALGQSTIDSTDLYFALATYDEGYEPLDDLLDSKAEGETKTIREKFQPAYLNMIKNSADGKIYSLTYGGGAVGIVYNKKMFDDAGIKELPRTTNELVGICDNLARNDMLPWVHFKEGGYWHMLSEVFVMQYDGYDYYTNNLYGCKDENGNSPSLDVLTRKDGRYETLKMYEKILTPDYVLSGSNSGDHITMQTRFIHGQAAMMVNGSWMANEMESVGKTEGFGVMKTPVLSSIVKKLTTVKKDSQLSAVVEAIDTVSDGTKSLDDYKKGASYVVGDLEVSEADWNYIAAARKTTAMNYSGHGVFIPSYSDQKEGAKEFLRYFYSDEGYDIFLNTTRVVLPLAKDAGEIDTSDWDSFTQENYKLLESTEQYASSYNANKHPIYERGGAINMYANRPYIQYLTALNEKDRLSADQLWDDVISTINGNYESTWLPNIK